MTILLPGRNISTAAFLLFVLASCSHPVTVVTLERDGRQRSVAVKSGDEPGFRIRVVLPSGASSKDVEVTYTCVNRLVQPYTLGAEGRPATRRDGSGAADFFIPQCNGRVLVYNVTEPSGCNLLERRVQELKGVVNGCQGQKSYIELADTVASLSRLRTELTDDSQKAEAEASSRLKEMDEELELRELEKREFISMRTPAALAELKRTQELVRRLVEARTEYQKKTREDAEAYRRSLEDLSAQIAEAQAARDALCRSQTEERDRLSAEKRECGGPGARTLRLGAIIPGKDRKTAWYRVDSINPDNGMPYLVHQGDFPVLESGDELYVQIVDRDPGSNGSPFGLQVTLTQGVEPNPAPLRPSFGEGEALQATSENAQASERRPFSDVILPADRELRGGQVPTVSLTYPGKGADDKPVDVTVVSAVLPQVRTLYRFNLSAGMALSSLDEVRYTKKTITADDLDTADQHEGVYQTVKSGNTFQVQPLLAFTVYWLPMDIQKPFAWTDLLPNPTIGFGLLAPLDNLYLGFSHEFVRNLQFVWGLHLGKVTQLLDEDSDALELHSPDAPKTIQAIEAGMFGSLQFNFNFFARIFGK